MKTLLSAVLLLMLMMNMTFAASFHPNATTKAKLHHNEMGEQYRLADQMRYSWFICNRWHHLTPYSPLHYCRQCSKIYKYDLSYEYHHDYQAWLKHRWQHSPKMVCQRLDYGPTEYHTFTSARDAKRWWINYCGCSKTMLQHG